MDWFTGVLVVIGVWYLVDEVKRRRRAKQKKGGK
jgi:hypothetical protein